MSHKAIANCKGDWENRSSLGVTTCPATNKVGLLLLLWRQKWSEAQSCPTLCDSMDCIVRGILQARILEGVAFPFSMGSSQPRDPTQVSLIEGRFFTNWATREANTGVGRLSLLQKIFPTHKLNRGLLHCTQILYQLSYQGSPLRLKESW